MERLSLEIEEHCVQSAEHACRELAKHLDNPEIGPEMIQHIQLLQRLFRDFMDEIGPSGGDWDRHYRPMATDHLSMALGRLRALVGAQIGKMAAKYDLEVADELASTVPDQAGWFFEKPKMCQKALRGSDAKSMHLLWLTLAALLNAGGDDRELIADLDTLIAQDPLGSESSDH